MELQRYPIDTPAWQIEYEGYLAVARQAEKQGKWLKAKRYRKKADRAFLKAGGLILTI